PVPTIEQNQRRVLRRIDFLQGWFVADELVPGNRGRNDTLARLEAQAVGSPVARVDPSEPALLQVPDEVVQRTRNLEINVAVANTSEDSARCVHSQQGDPERQSSNPPTSRPDCREPEPKQRNREHVV